jgi:hypothetical protein
MTAPNRRWFQWSLRTLFVVVTVFGCWLGYEFNWIRQRLLINPGPTPFMDLRARLDCFGLSESKELPRCICKSS